MREPTLRGARVTQCGHFYPNFGSFWESCGDHFLAILNLCWSFLMLWNMFNFLAVFDVFWLFLKMFIWSFWKAQTLLFLLPIHWHSARRAATDDDISNLEAPFFSTTGGQNTHTKSYRPLLFSIVSLRISCAMMPPDISAGMKTTAAKMKIK